MYHYVHTDEAVKLRHERIWRYIKSVVRTWSYKACSKKDRTFAIKTLFYNILIKHCPLQSSPLYWRYSVHNVSSTVEMLPATHFLWWRAVLLSRFPKKMPNFLNSSPTSKEGALRLLSSPTGRF